MKKTLCTIFIIFITGVTTIMPAQADTLTILHVNDTHSNLAPHGERKANLECTTGGIARAASLIGMTKMTDPNVLVLHAGDLFIGDLFFNCFFGVPELQMMLAMGFDAMTVGNHEFDLMPSTLEEALDNAFAEGSFPLLSANAILDHPDVAGLKDYIFPFTVKEFENIKVGIFGLTTPETNILSQPYPVFIDTNFVQTAGAMVDTLSNRECDVIICLSHLGYAYDDTVAKYVPGINLIIGGHDHYLFEEPQSVTNDYGWTTYIVQADAFYSYMGKVQLILTEGKVTSLEWELIHLDNSIPEEPTTKATVEYLIGEIENTYGPVYSQQIAYSEGFFEEVAKDLDVSGYKDTPVGRLVTTAYREAFGTDIAIQACGSTAQPIYEGPLVAADLFRVVGYGFNTDNGLGYRMATFKLSGEALIAGLEFGLSEIEKGDEFLIQVSGMEYEYQFGNPAWERVVEGTTVGGEPIDMDSLYTVTANEFVPMFLDFAEIPYSNLHIYSDTTEFEILRAYVTTKDTISPTTESLITDINDPDPLPASFTLEQNYPNPFNPSTQIPFILKKVSHIELDIYDIKGRRVKQLYSGILPAGRHIKSWDGTNQYGVRGSSGIYFYRINNGSKYETRKMLMLK